MTKRKGTDVIANVALIVPLLLVNTVAAYGQVMWAHEHLTPGSRFWWVAVGFAAAVESIGIYLAAEAHRALLAGDASLRLRLGSYAVGLLAGILNYAHFAPGLSRPNAPAIVFGVLSTLSPVLWAIRSRSMSRDRLRALQLIDGRAVKFTAIQWVLFPRLSATAFRAAVWAGETNPTKARALAKSPAREATPPVAAVEAYPDWRGEIQRALATLQQPVQTVPVPVVTKPVKVLEKPRRAVPAAGQQRFKPREHPLWDEWVLAHSGTPWTAEDLVSQMKSVMDRDISLAAAGTMMSRWEKALADSELTSA
jgi:hypothetical protein